MNAIKSKYLTMGMVGKDKNYFSFQKQIKYTAL